MTSLAADMPAELFENILYFVGNEDRLDPTGDHDNFDPSAWREEIKHLSVCAATCVYWARLSRPRMFEHVALLSHNDLCSLQTLLRNSSSSHRIDSIGTMLFKLTLFYTLGDQPWFYHARGLNVYGASGLHRIFLHIIGPATPAFIAASSGGFLLHPLSISTPRILQMSIFHDIAVAVYIKNIHLPKPTVLFDLLRDCVSLQPESISCETITWDDPAVTPSFPRLKFTCAFRPPFMTAWGCTDDAFVAALAHTAFCYKISRRWEVPYLGSPPRRHPHYAFMGGRMYYVASGPRSHSIYEQFELGRSKLEVSHEETYVVVDHSSFRLLDLNGYRANRAPKVL